MERPKKSVVSIVLGRLGSPKTMGKGAPAGEDSEDTDSVGGASALGEMYKAMKAGDMEAAWSAFMDAHAIACEAKPAEDEEEDA